MTMLDLYVWEMKWFQLLNIEIKHKVKGYNKMKQKYEEMGRWEFTSIHQPHKEDIENRIGETISMELYDKIIEKMEDWITYGGYDDYKEPFLNYIENYAMDEIEEETN